MLNSFFIKNFRLFRHLTAEGLGRVNLVVGRNNVGKSAFLEAIEVYVSNAAPRNLLGLISAREETWYGRAQTEFQRVHGNPIRHIFFGHRVPDPGEEGISLGPEGRDRDLLQLITAAFQTVADEGGILQRTRLNPEDIARVEGDVEFALMAQEGDKLRRIMRLDREIEYVRRPATAPEPDMRYPLQVVPTRNMLPQRVASLWDITGLTDLAQEVVEGIRLIEPDIQDIAFVEGSVSLRESRVPLLRIQGVREPLPLKSMGDGMTRLFHIILALVNAQNGILLIDEFENGLHWSVQEAVWQTVFRLADRLNVQVFATTHSRDCIAGFEQAWTEHDDAGAFFRLDVSGDAGVKARRYTLDTLNDSLHTAVEVR